MNLSLYHEALYSEEKQSIFRPASIISLTIHLIIFTIAIYGLPNLGRELPENKELIIRRGDRIPRARPDQPL